MDYSSTNEATWDTHHSTMGQKLMERLSVSLSLAAPRKFPHFANWRRVPILLPFQKNMCDSGLFSMKYIEFYDGEGHGSLRTTIDPVRILFVVIISLNFFFFHLTIFPCRIVRSRWGQKCCNIWPSIRLTESMLPQNSFSSVLESLIIPSTHCFISVRVMFPKCGRQSMLTSSNFFMSVAIFPLKSCLVYFLFVAVTLIISPEISVSLKIN